MSSNTTTSHPIDKCQICDSPTLESVLFLGYIPPVNTMPLLNSKPKEELGYPLEMVRCKQCTLVQIGLEVDQKVLFPPEYPYLSGTTRILRENFAEQRDEAVKIVGLKTGTDLVVDIGSNDGTLLSNYHEAGYKVLGVEPTRASDVANGKGIRTKMAFFTQELAQNLRKEYGAAKLITATNVFAHIPEVHKIVDGIIDWLADDGVFMSENHYLYDLVETVQYDTIYHEHLRYYSLEALMGLFKPHGLEVFHVKKIPTHGGSIRVYACRKGQRPIEASVQAAVNAEREMGLHDGSGLKEFRKRVVNSKTGFYKLVSPIRAKGEKIYGIGAPSRASTLINYVGIDDGVLDCVLEVPGSHKINKFIPGTRIPVLEETKLIQDQPEYALLLSWHISKELIENLRKKGYKGKFIVPLPEPHIVD